MTTDISLPNATESTALTAPTTQSTSTTTNAKAKPKKKRKRTPKPSPIKSQLTLRTPTWSYIYLQHLPPTTTFPSNSAPLDPVTAHLHLHSALTRFLGTHGSAIPMDILRLSGCDVWIRVPAEDRDALIAGVGGWVSGKGEGWRVMGTSSWDARAMGGREREGGRDLFGG